jgi:hypothetical protein
VVEVHAKSSLGARLKVESDHVIFISPTPWSVVFEARCHIDSLDLNTPSISVIDLSRLCYVESAKANPDARTIHDAYCPETIAQFQDALSCVTSRTLIIMWRLPWTFSTIGLYRTISMTSGILGVITDGLNPISTMPRFSDNRIGAKIGRTISWLRRQNIASLHLFLQRKWINSLPLRFLGIRRTADLHIVDSLVSARHGLRFIGQRTLSVPVETFYFDHLNSADGSNASADSARYAVYLDQALPNHPDNMALIGVREVMNVQAFYKSLNDFFRRIEAELGLTVIVALHPKAGGAESRRVQFNGRLGVMGKTMDLIRNSSLVIGHHSASISYAVIARKPILVLTNDVIESCATSDFIHARGIKGIASELKTQVLNSDQGPELNLHDYSSLDYDHYIARYLRHPNTKHPFWDAINQGIAALSCKPRRLRR